MHATGDFRGGKGALHCFCQGGGSETLVTPLVTEDKQPTKKAAKVKLPTDGIYKHNMRVMYVRQQTIYIPRAYPGFSSGKRFRFIDRKLESTHVGPYVMYLYINYILLIYLPTYIHT